MRTRLSLLALLLLLSAPALAETERPDDVPGWRGLAWGAEAADLRAALGDRLVELPGRWHYGGAYADLALRTAAFGDLDYLVFFQMDADTDRLRQVLLERRDGQATPADYLALIDDLTARFGPPDGECARTVGGAGTVGAELVWRFPTTTIHAVFLDFRTTGVLFRDPGTLFDPTVTAFETRRIVRRSLPRRLLVRLHPTGIAALQGTCAPLADDAPPP